MTTRAKSRKIKTKRLKARFFISINETLKINRYPLKEKKKISHVSHRI